MINDYNHDLETYNKPVRYNMDIPQLKGFLTLHLMGLPVNIKHYSDIKHIRKSNTCGFGPVIYLWSLLDLSLFRTEALAENPFHKDSRLLGDQFNFYACYECLIRDLSYTY